MEIRRVMIFIILLCIILLPVCSLSLLLDGDGVVKPDDPYVYYGQDLILWCNITNPRSKDNSSLLYFKLGNQEIPRQYIHIINTKSIKLRYPVTLENFDCSERTRSFNFQCLSRTKPVPLDHQLVKVDHAPEPVKNFQCRVYDWENMTCTWDLGVNYCNPDHIKVSLVWTVLQGQYDCPNMTEDRTACTWLQTGTSLQPDMTYHMVVLVHNEKYNKSEKSAARTELFTINTRDIVQPAPIKGLTVTKIRNNSTCLLAKWTNNYDHRARKYKVIISTDEKEMMMLVDKQKEYVLCNLDPYTLYTIAVSNKPMPDGRTPTGYWSDTVETTVLTPEDTPGAAPILCSGCFTEVPCEEVNCKRNIEIYWKPVDKKYCNGIITGYKIESFSESDGVTTTNIIDDGSQTSYTVSLTSTSLYHITITARTSSGYSKYASTIVIPDKSETPRPVSKILVEAANTTTTNSYIIKWTDRNMDAMNYTLYYCQRQDVTLDCRDEILWIHLNPSVYQHTLHLPKSQTTYHIGLSREVQQQNGIIASSGINWNKCIYIKDTKPKSAPPNVRFSDIQPDQALLIEWDRLDCVDNVAFIKEYLIQICLVNEPNGKCIDKVKNISVPEYMTSYKIDGLQPFKTYRVITRAVSHSGLGPPSEPISAEVIDNSLKTGEIIGICVGGMFVLALLAFAIFRCYRCAQREKEKCSNIRIKTYLPEDLTSVNQFNSKQGGHFKNRPLPPPPLVLNIPASGADSGYEASVPQYEPIGEEREPPRTNIRKGNDSITSETLLITSMESQNLYDHHNKDTSPYAVSDVTKLNCDKHDGYPSDNESADKLDSYTKFDLSDSGCVDPDNNSTHFNDLNSSINPQTTQIVNFVMRPPNVRISEVTQMRPVWEHPVPQIKPTDNSDTSDDYVPHSTLDSPTDHNEPIVCEVVSPVSPTGGIHSTQTLLIRRADPQRPLSDYLHKLPLEYFQDPNQDESGPTTEL